MKRHGESRNKDLMISAMFKFHRSFFFTRKLPEQVKKIAILKFSGIGDSILSLPSIKSLKEKTRGEISVICSTENEIIFRDQPFVDKIYTFNIEEGNSTKFFNFFLKMRKKRFDVSIDTSQSSIISAFVSRYISKYNIGFENLKNSARNNLFDKLVKLNPKKHMVKCYYDLMSDFKIRESLKLIRPNVSKEIDFSKKGLSEDDLVGIHATSPFEYRNWPKERYAKIIDWLASKNKTILLFGGPKEKVDNDKIISILKNKERVFNFAGEISFKEMFHILPKLKLFLANDGGPMHLAASFDIPTIGIFGSDTPFRYAPFNEKSYSLYKPFKNGPINRAYESVWPTEETLEIPDKITEEEVRKVIERILEK